MLKEKEEAEGMKDKNEEDNGDEQEEVTDHWFNLVLYNIALNANCHFSK